MRGKFQHQYSDSGELAMVGGDGDPRNGVLAHETENGRHGKGQELIVSPVKAFSAFGMAPEARSTVAVLWREREHAGEVESEKLMTNS